MVTRFKTSNLLLSSELSIPLFILLFILIYPGILGLMLLARRLLAPIQKGARLAGLDVSQRERESLAMAAGHTNTSAAVEDRQSRLRVFSPPVMVSL